MTPLITGLPLPPWCQPIFSSILESAGCLTARVTSVGRGPRAQAQAMFNNCLHPPSPEHPKGGAQEQLDLYKPPGQAVIRIFSANYGSMPDDAVIRLMAAQIALDPDAVSHHCREGVFDIEQNSIPDPCKPKLEAQMSKDPRVVKWLHENGCYHIELLKSQGALNA